MGQIDYVQKFIELCQALYKQALNIDHFNLKKHSNHIYINELR